jgi:hypothetical protein
MADVVKLHPRISLTEGLRRVLPKCMEENNPGAYASWALHRALSLGYIRIWCDGTLMKNFGNWERQLLIFGEQTDGQWFARMHSTAALVKPMEDYEWMLSEEDVDAFVENFAAMLAKMRWY